MINLTVNQNSITDNLQLFYDSLISNSGFILIIPLFLLIWIIGRFIKFTIKRNKSMPPDAKNGIFIVITILQLFLFGVGSAYTLRIDNEFIIGLSTIFATAIGFASTSVAANIVGGFYIIITRPFGVGDYIQTQGREGIVQEIGLNFTKIMQIDKTLCTIPNSKLLNASLTNYNLNLTEEIKRRKIEKEIQIKEYSIRIPEVLTESLFDTFDQDEIVRYASKVQLKLNVTDPPISLEFVKDQIKTVCEEFDDVFGYPVRFYFGRHIFRQDTYFVITTSSPYTIFNYYPLFLEKIVEKVFSSLQEGQS